MDNSLLERYVRASARNLIILNGALVLIIIGIFALNARYYRNYLSGPYAMPRSELLSLANAGEADRYYVTINGDKGLDTGYQEVSQTIDKTTRTVKSERVTASYIILALDSTLLMVKAAESEPRSAYVGALVPFPADLRSDMLNQIRADSPELADPIDSALLPLMLDATPFRTGGTIGLAIMLPLLGLGGFNLVRGFRRIADPQKHPAIRALAGKGSFPEVASQIENEVRNGAGVVTVGKTTITPSWILSRAGTTLTVLHRDDIAWIYLRVVQRRAYGIPVGKNFAAVIKARPNSSLMINANEARVSQLLQEISQRAPWALTGFSAQIEQDWKKNRAAVLAAVDQRRAQVTGRQPF